MREKTSWKEMFESKFKETGDSFETLVTTLTEKQMNEHFHYGYGGTEGYPFTAWSENWVYFPVCYDGSEWIGKVRRNPCDVATDHQGGG
jgi:hypothetical protein